MASSFQLRIITPTREAVNETVAEVTAPGTVGEFGILPDHAAFLSSLEIGCLTYRADSGAIGNVAIRDGFAEVADNMMTVLAAAAESVAEVDREQADADLQAARTKLEQLSPIDPDYEATDADRRWAEARLRLDKL